MSYWMLYPRCYFPGRRAWSLKFSRARILFCEECFLVLKIVNYAEKQALGFTRFCPCWQRSRPAWTTNTGQVICIKTFCNFVIEGYRLSVPVFLGTHLLYSAFSSLPPILTLAHLKYFPGGIKQVTPAHLLPGGSLPGTQQSSCHLGLVVSAAKILRLSRNPLNFISELSLKQPQKMHSIPFPF